MQLLHRYSPHAPVDLASVAAFRILYGAVLLYNSLSYLLGGWVDEFYVRPRFFFSFTGLTGIPRPGGEGMYVVFIAMAVAAAGVMAGCCYRIAAMVLSGSVIYVFLLDKATYQNHYYLISLVSLIMVFAPAHRMWSMDALRRPATRSDTGPRFWLWLLQFQIGIAYFYGGIAKLNADWLQAAPLQIWLQDRTWLPVVGPWMASSVTWLSLAWAGMIFDLLVVPGLLWSRTRTLTCFAAVFFHLCNTLLWNIGIFPWFMLGALVLYFPAGRIRRLVSSRGPSPTGIAPAPPSRQTSRQLMWIGLFVVWQLLFPLRHLLYPGNVNWTEEGQLFSWRMMLNQKTSVMRLIVTAPSTGRSRPVNVAEYLRPHQISPMGKDPDMILEFAHFIRDQFKTQGQSNVEIRVLCLASLNGRRPQLLVNPNLDLANLDRTWGHQSWIVPLQESLRDDVWSVPVNQWEQVLADDIQQFRTEASGSHPR